MTSNRRQVKDRDGTSIDKSSEGGKFNLVVSDDPQVTNTATTITGSRESRPHSNGSEILSSKCTNTDGAGRQQTNEAAATASGSEANSNHIEEADRLADNRMQPAQDSLAELGLFTREAEDYTDYANRVMKCNTPNVSPHEGTAVGVHSANSPKVSVPVNNYSTLPSGETKEAKELKRTTRSPAASRSKSRFNKPISCSEEYLDTQSTLPAVKLKPITPQLVRNRQLKNQINPEQVDSSNQFLVEKQPLDSATTSTAIPNQLEQKNASALASIKRLVDSSSSKKQAKNKSGSSGSMASGAQWAMAQLSPPVSRPMVCGLPPRTTGLCLGLALFAMVCLLVQKWFLAPSSLPPSE